jgi:hypothetical protein
VRRRHLQGRGGVQALHRECGDRRGQRTRCQQRRKARRGKDRGGVEGELRGPVTGVVADHHHPPRAAIGQQVRGDPGGRPAHHCQVHAVRPGPQRPPQSRGAERQRRAHPLGQVGHGVRVGAHRPGEHLLQFGPVRR